MQQTAFELYVKGKVRVKPMGLLVIVASCFFAYHSAIVRQQEAEFIGRQSTCLACEVDVNPLIQAVLSGP